MLEQAHRLTHDALDLGEQADVSDQQMEGRASRAAVARSLFKFSAGLTNHQDGHAFSVERARDRAPDTLARASDNSGLAAQSKLHTTLAPSRALRDEASPLSPTARAAGLNLALGGYMAMKCEWA